MRKLIFALLIFPSLVLAASPHQELAALLKNLHSMQADFTQVSLSGDHMLISGKMALQTPGKFRWQINSPNERLIIASKKSAWIYDKDLQQAVRKRFRDVGSVSPAVLLSSSVKKLEKAFTISKHDEWFELQPKQQSSFNAIALSFEDKKLTAMKITNNLGEKSLIKFSNVHINAKLNHSLFKFTPPVGTDVM